MSFGLSGRKWPSSYYVAVPLRQVRMISTATRTSGLKGHRAWKQAHASPLLRWKLTWYRYWLARSHLKWRKCATVLSWHVSVSWSGSFSAGGAFRPPYQCVSTIFELYTIKSHLLKMEAHEIAIQNAIHDLNADLFTGQRKAAKAYGVPRSSLQACLAGHQTHATAHQYEQRWTLGQEGFFSSSVDFWRVLMRSTTYTRSHTRNGYPNPSHERGHPANRQRMEIPAFIATEAPLLYRRPIIWSSTSPGSLH